MVCLGLLLALAAPPDLVAVGTVVGPDPERSVAIVRGSGRSRVVGVGDTAFGGRVSAIEKGRVLLDYEGESVELLLPRAEARSAGPARRIAPAAEPAGFTIERHELERRLAGETSRILAETTLVPVQSGSQVTGFTL